ncbi:hypothetical protein QK289_15600 [Exiguobacterium antarcticum]|uniref:Uncharacterized protein n=1 Tax=Exiguobacterium antarcticum TaxID=132920 RepID=A0ABT6R6I5_9BACL|nr:hypothetical protein [Exiguobacterium antarcticum]MDI3236440.1 hypothetical protein [Exiguobacterium antarcticum]
MNYLLLVIGIVAIFIVVTTLFFLVNGRKEATGQNYVSDRKSTPVIFYSGFIVFVIVLGFVVVSLDDSPINDVKVEDAISKQTNPFSDLNPFKKEPLNQN